MRAPRILSRSSVLALLLSACAHAPVVDRVSDALARRGQPVAPTLDESLARLRKTLAKLYADSKEPSVALGIVSGERLIWFDGFGFRDPSHGLPVNQDSAFRIGSITKTLTGVALLQLRDAGKLSLDDPLSRYIPEAAEVVSPSAGHSVIQLRHLVSHTSGLPRDPVAWGATGPSEAALRSALKGMKLDFDPGTAESYSNYAMGLAGLVIEKASGETYREYMRRHVFEPLQMGHTAFEAEALPAGVLAAGYQREGGSYAPIAKQADLGAQEACGGAYSSVADLARYAAFELRAWSGGDDAVLARSSRLESQTPMPFVLPSGDFVGVNWILNQGSLGRRVWHNGSIDGYRAVLALYPNRGLAIVGLTAGDQESLLWTMADAAIDALDPFVPVTTGQLGPAMQQAMARLTDFVDAPALSKLGPLFSKGFRDELHDAHVESQTEELHGKLGVCQSPLVLVRAGSSFASFWRHCEKQSVRMEVGLELETGLINFWTWHEP